eukprot:c45155_g1_i1 orf=2-160(-)
MHGSVSELLSVSVKFPFAIWWILNSFRERQVLMQGCKLFSSLLVIIYSIAETG